MKINSPEPFRKSVNKIKLSSGFIYYNSQVYPVSNKYQTISSYSTDSSQIVTVFSMLPCTVKSFAALDTNLMMIGHVFSQPRLTLAVENLHLRPVIGFWRSVRSPVFCCAIVLFEMKNLCDFLNIEAEVISLSLQCLAYCSICLGIFLVE